MGMLIALSGLDGAGKTTVANVVREELITRGVSVEQVEPGPSRVWRLVQLLKADNPSLGRHITPNALGVAANLERMAFVADFVVPALSLYDVVISQRYVLDWAALGRALGADAAEVDLIRSAGRIDGYPVQSCFLRVDAEIAKQRLRARGRSCDAREDEELLTRTAAAYEQMLGDFDDVLALDATRPPAVSAAAIVAAAGFG
jgi:dTMP kinase